MGELSIETPASRLDIWFSGFASGITSALVSNGLGEEAATVLAAQAVAEAAEDQLFREQAAALIEATLKRYEEE